MGRRVSIAGVSLEVSFTTADNRVVAHDFTAWVGGSEDLDQGMDQAAAKIAWAGAMLGLMYEAEEVLDAEYRGWRADEGERILAHKPTLAEHKVKQLIESSPDFMVWKRKLAGLHGRIRTMETVVRALSAQADALRSRGANRRAEMRATGISTPSDDPEERGAGEAADERDRRMREIHRSRDT
jgi:hypothetical protein